MNAAEQDLQIPQATTHPSLKSGVDWVGKHWPRVRLAHEGTMLDKIVRQQKCVEVSARNAMTGKHEDTTGWPEGDDMGVAIGDHIENHYYTSPVVSQSAETSNDQPLWKKLAPYLVGAVLVCGGSGLGYWFGRPSQQPPQQPAVISSPDRWIEYDVRAGDPNVLPEGVTTGETE